jgi:hypothetical protein
MWRKLFIVNLFLVLALNPAAQAIGPLVAPADAPAHHEHGSMIMDCGQLDPANCVDFDSCASGSHANCDAKTKSSLFLPQLADHPRGQLYMAHPPDSYLSLFFLMIRRPPRNA